MKENIFKMVDFSNFTFCGECDLTDHDGDRFFIKI